MTRRGRQVALTLVAVGCAIALALELGRAEARPTLRDRPADWALASQIADGALDRDSPHRFALWRAAHAHAKLLAPHRLTTDAAFVRAGLFHWYELEPADRARVLRAAEPLMRDFDFFSRMHAPMLQLTGDFGWLRRNAPPRLDARVALRNLALARGLFADYRALREEIRVTRLRTFAARRRTDDVTTLLTLLPERLDGQDAPLVRGILEELDRQAFDREQISPRIEELVAFALDHDLGPLTGLRPLLEPKSRLRDVTRARVALALDQPQLATRIEALAVGIDDVAWQPYYLDRARFAAARHDAANAQAYLVRAASGGTTVEVLAAAADVARALGRTQDEQRYRAELARMPRPWQRLCSKDEICTTASRQGYAATGRVERIALANAQSDETPPYVEISVDGTLVTEGEVRDARTFDVPLTPGAHEIEVRLVNERTRNGIQRRVRVS
jgi:hypothetical protein